MQAYKNYIIFYVAFINQSIFFANHDNKKIDTTHHIITSTATKKDSSFLPWQELCRNLSKNHTKPTVPHTVFIEPNKEESTIKVTICGQEQTYPTYSFPFVLQAIAGSFSSKISRLHREVLDAIVSGKTRDWSFAYNDTQSYINQWSEEKNNWISRDTKQHKL